MITEAIDFKYLLLENYKKLTIQEDELAVILLVDHLLSQGNKFITADMLALKMSLDAKNIDKILASLIVKKYLEYNKDGNSLSPLKEKLYKDFEKSISKEESINKAEVKKIVEDCVSNIEKLFNKALSPVEISKVKDWVMYGYRLETIIDAAKEALSKNKKTIRSMDKVLIDWQRRNDIETDGISTITQDWNKNLEETIKIAKTPWIDQDDNDGK